MDQLGWVDYIVFGLMLALSVVIGLGKGSDRGSSANQLLLADGKLPMLPVAMSLLASFLSSVTLMGQPAEVYLYGAQLWIFGAVQFICVPIVGCTTIPFFVKKKYLSVNQYLGERFSRPVQLAASILLTVQMMMFLSLVLYAPALAMYQVTGFEPTTIVTVLFFACIVYTALGGIRGVVWADAFQIIIIFASLSAVLIKGTYDVGGVQVVWERNDLFNRTNFFDFDLDLTKRYTFWSTSLGLAFLHMALAGGNQLLVQRYITVASMKEVWKMLWLNALGWTLIVWLCTYAGFLIFAKYHDCDPLESHRVAKADQLLPLYVLETVGSIPGFTGIFISGIFSAGLSTVSTGLNSLAAIWFTELGAFFKTTTDSQSGRIVKILSTLIGFGSYLLVFIIPYMGPLVPLGMTLSSTAIGAIFGMFVLGIYVPFANSAGVLTGMASSVGFLTWVCWKSITGLREGLRGFPTLPTSTANCSVPVSSTKLADGELMPYLFRISHTWYCAIAISMTLVIGIGISYVTEKIATKKPHKFEERSGKPIELLSK